LEQNNFFYLLIFSNGSEYSASVYQKINHKLETGISVAWSSTKDETRLGLGCVYKLDNDSYLRVIIQFIAKY
jgi:voltage-dependent anion-selective channel, putative